MERLRDSENDTQIQIEDMGYSDLNAAAWNAYLEQDEEMLLKLSTEVESRRIALEASAGDELELQRYFGLSRSISRSIDNLEDYKQRTSNG